MAGEGTISRSLGVLKTVLNIVSLYLEKLKKTLFCWVLAWKAPENISWWAQVWVSHIMGRATRTRAGRHDVSVFVKRRQAFLKPDKHQPISNHLSAYIWGNRGVSKETHYVCKQQDLCSSTTSQPDHGFVWWRSGTAREQGEQSEDRQTEAWCDPEKASGLRPNLLICQMGKITFYHTGLLKDQKRRQIPL